MVFINDIHTCINIFCMRTKYILQNNLFLKTEIKYNILVREKC